MIYTVIDFDYSVYTGMVRVLVQRMNDTGNAEFHTVHFPMDTKTDVKDIQRVIENRIKTKDGELDTVFSQLKNMTWRSE